MATLFAVPAPSIGAVPEPTDYFFAYGGPPANGQVVNLTGADVTVVTFPDTVSNTSFVALQVREGAFPYTQTWDIHLHAPTGETLAVGTYANVRRTPDIGVAAMRISGNGSSCNQIYGEFAIHELTRNADGALLTFAATFSQSCSDWSFAHKIMSGEIRYRSAADFVAWSTSATSLAFGDQPPGTASATQFVTVTAKGSLPVTLGASVVGTDAVDFSLSDPNECNGTLAPGQECTLGVTFTPASYGGRTAEVRVTVDELPAFFGMKLTGNGRLVTTTELSGPAALWYPLAANLEAVVTPASSGTLQFKHGGNVLAEGTLIGGQLSMGVLLPPGSQWVGAAYLGSSTSFPSESALLPIDVGVLTDTSISQSASTVSIGEPVTLQAEVAGAGSYRLSGGTLSIIDLGSGATLVSIPVADDAPRAFVQVRLMTPGVRQYVARYSGHGLFGQSESIAASVTVQKRSVLSYVSSVPGIPYYPASHYLVARMDPVPDGGSVTFREGAVILGTAPVNLATGEATLAVTLLPGSHSIGISYAGTANFAPRIDCCSIIRVWVATETSAAADPETVQQGSAVTIAGTVSAIGVSHPQAGMLTITKGDTFVASAPVTSTNREVSATVSLAQGSHVFKVAYSGDGDYAASSKFVNVVVTAPSGDTQPPAGNVIINGGASFTSSAAVNLTLSASDPTPGSGVVNMQFSSTGLPGSWTALEPYASARSWLLEGVDGGKQVYVRYQDAAGNLSVPASAGIVLDRTVPLAATPTEFFITGRTIGFSSAPVRVTFGTTDATSGVGAYGLGQSTNGGSSYTGVSVSGTSGSVVRTLGFGTTSYRFRTRATDRAGNRNVWTAGSAFTVSKIEQSAAAVAYAGTWTTKSHSSATAGKYRLAAAAGSRATYTFTGRAIAIVAQVGPSAGKADVYIDGIRVTTLDLYASSTSWRKVVFSASFAGPEKHTVQLRALGTKRAASNGTRVALDAFLVLR